MGEPGLSWHQQDILRHLIAGWALYHTASASGGTWMLRGRCGSGDGWCFSYPHGGAANGLVRRGLLEPTGTLRYGITEAGRMALLAYEPLGAKR